MQWEKLTFKDIEKLSKEDTIVVIPIGSMEIHGPHLPLGTDALVIYKLALEVAKREEALVLPPIYYACAVENRHFPGNISLKAEIFLELIESLCDEIGRNGFKKILILNGHGGNKRSLSLFIRELLWKKKRYQVYILMDPWSPIADVIDSIKETEEIGHACEIETSFILYLFPELAKLEEVKDKAKTGSAPKISYIETSVDWISYCIEGYLGDPRKASKEKGSILFNKWVERVSKVIRAIKEDKITERVLEAYFKRVG